MIRIVSPTQPISKAIPNGCSFKRFKDNKIYLKIGVKVLEFENIATDGFYRIRYFTDFKLDEIEQVFNEGGELWKARESSSEPFLIYETLYQKKRSNTGRKVVRLDA